MASFSGAVKLVNVSDFISPSQACVVNLDGSKLQDQSGKVDIQNRTKHAQHTSDSGFSQTKAPNTEGAVKVTLHDCLACSGCITSAETVLLEHQSVEEFREKLRQPGVTVVVSMSAQSRAALAALYEIPPKTALRRLAGFFKSLGVKYVFDLGAARDIALAEAAQEFIDRFRANKGTENPLQPKPPLSDRFEAPSTSSSGILPVLASACPGWVCYAEKTHGEYILPYIGTSKSPQAIMGTLVKRYFCKVIDVSPEQIYHCTVMPCYDKKLEAARDDFNAPGTQIPEVDSCLTSLEVQDLLNEQGLHLNSIPEAPLDSLTSTNDDSGDLYGLRGGSGGYLNFIYRTAARTLYGVQIPDGDLPMKILRNADIQEISLTVDGNEVLKFALAYGFRNIQTIVQKIKRGICRYHYIEIMACPSGCVNGGGQPKPVGGKSPKDVLKDVEAAYHHQDVIPRLPMNNPVLKRIYNEWVGGGPHSETAKRQFHTQYHKREKTLTTTLSDW